MLKSYNFWVRLISVLVLLLRVIGSEFGFTIDSGLIIDIATVVASILVVLGVIQAPVGVTTSTEEDQKNIGGNFMKTMEQVKADILTAKNKLIETFGTDEKVYDITGILDAIIEDNTETTETPVEEAVQVEAVEELSEPETNIETIVIESAPEIQAEILEAVKEDDVLSESEQAKLNEILRTKIIDLITRDMDEIIAEVTK